MRTDNLRRISICQLSTFQWNFQQDIARYNAMGFQSVGLWRRKVEDFGIDNSADLLHHHKMKVSSLHWAGGFTGDGQKLDVGVQDSIEAIQLASKLNADCLIIHPGSRNGHTLPHATQLVRGTLNQLLPVSLDYGVKLVLEPMLGASNSAWTFMTKFQQTIDMIRSLQNRVGLVLDLHNLGFCPELLDSLDSFIDLVQLVQVADRTSAAEHERCPLGKGSIPLDRWLNRLKRHGYEGQFELEIHGKEVENRDYFEMLEHTAAYFGSPILQRSLAIDPDVQLPKSLTPAHPRFQSNRDR